MTGLQRHIPELALEWVAETPNELWRQFDGTLVFADISGFTALAERLAQRGRMGGEELVETLGAVFAEMLDIAHLRGGSLLKFGGDALLLFFRGEEHAVQAASAAVEMRQALRKAAEIPTSVGPLRLTMSVGLHSGTVDFFLVGSTHRELILLGPAADQVVETEGTANAREILVSAATAALLPKDATKARDDGELLLRWRKARVAAHGPSEAPSYDDSLESLFPGELGTFLAPGAPDPEHRVACIAFIRFSGTDALLTNDGPEALAQALQTTVGTVQDVLVDEGVTLLAIDLDKDGGKFFLASGVPHAHEDDEGVMLRAMRRIMDVDLPLSLQVGVNRGHVFAAEVGTSRRAAYSAMGDTTNTAARIAAQTPPGSIYAHPSVLDECLTRFAVEEAGPLSMKGKTAPQIVYAVGEELGLREREGLEVDEFIGRATEARVLREAIDVLATGTGQVISLVGDTGLGKTRLLAEAISQLDKTQYVALRAEPYGANSPYRMFRDPLRAALGIERAGLQHMQRSLAKVVATFDPSLSPWLALVGSVVQVEMQSSPEVEDLELQFRPERTADAIIRLLELARPGPLVLVVDDAHWADEASAQLLGHLERACSNRPWLMLVARREAETGFRAESGSAVAIEPMPDENIRRLVELATEAAPPRPQVIDTIIRRAAGYPLFATELVRTLRDIGSLELLPESLEAAIASQVDSLDRTARRVMRYGSVLGRSFTQKVVAVLIEGEGHVFDPGVLERLEPYLLKDADDRLRFRSGLLRDTLYEGLSYRLRKRLHQAAGLAFEERAEDPLLAADSLALHFSRGEDFARAWKYARRAGDRARTSFANADAVGYYELALNAARRCDDVGATDTISVWRALGKARQRVGLFTAALDAYHQALRLVGDDRVSRAEILYERAWSKERAGRLSLALRDLTTGIRQVEAIDSAEAESVRAQLESLRAMVHFAQDRPGKALTSAEQAAVTARAADHSESLIRALNVVELSNLALHGPGDGRYLQEALVIADAAGDTGLRALVRANLGYVDAYAGRWNDAVRWMGQGYDLYMKTGNYVEAAYSNVNVGEILVNQHRIDEAETQLIEALRIMRALKNAEGIATIEIQLARIRLQQDRITEAIELAEGAAAEFARLGQPYFVLEASVVHAEALSLDGGADKALTALDNAIERAGDEAAFLQAKTACTRANLLAAVGRFDEAAQEVDQGLEAALEQGMLYEQGTLLARRADIQKRLGQTPDPHIENQAQNIFEALGVIA